MATDTVTEFENLMKEAENHHARAEWELKRKVLNQANRLCHSKGFPNAARQQRRVLNEVAAVQRRLGQNELAQQTLEDVLRADNTVDALRLSMLGELVVIYRQLNLVQKAAQTCQEQLDLAEELSLTADAEICRAVGNLGMINYQLSQTNNDTALLNTATKQCWKRVETAQALSKRLSPGSSTYKKARSWESIGYDRLTLCYAAQNKLKEAVLMGEKSQELTKDSPDPTIRALSRFFYGYALFRSGRRDEAAEQWNSPDDYCTSAIALCKEVSDEHCDYLEIVVEQGVDLDRSDNDGYTALDYAVFSTGSSSRRAEEVLHRALSKRLPYVEVKERYENAELRKHYREVFQDHLRPVLEVNKSTSIAAMRETYAKLLSEDAEKRRRFDPFKFVSFTDFKTHGRLPRSEDGLTGHYSSTNTAQPKGGPTRYAIFISYRWIGRADSPPIDGPDDSKHTQYHRMLDAIAGFLEIHDDLTEEQLDIWLVSEQKGRKCRLPLTAFRIILA